MAAAGSSVAARRGRRACPRRAGTGGPRASRAAPHPAAAVAAAAEADGAAGRVGKVPVLEPLGQGLARDVRDRLLPHLASDIRDGLNVKAGAASFFLFIACLCAAVAFGVGAHAVTDGQIGVIEMIISTAACGVVYSLTCGQPVALTGFGGAHLAFTGVLFATSQALGVAFLPMYAWVGIWSAGFLLLMTLTSVSNLVLYFTRFTDETFSALSSVIFCYEAVRNLSKPFVDPGANAAVALLSTMIATATVWTVFAVRGVRKTSLVCKAFRETLADFAPTIGVAFGTGLYIWATSSLDIGALASLNLPEGIMTTTGRPWVIDLWDAPLWLRWASCVPALFLSLLLFMDQVITTRLVNTPDNMLRKGYGYHLDLLVISLYTGVCSVLGLPWMTAATVPSLNHARSLATVSADGEVEGLLENRVSGAMIHLLMGASVLLLRPFLVQVPLAVFMGLFLYLGLNAARSNKFLNRVVLTLLSDPEKFRSAMGKKLKRVRPKATARKTIACYTAVQLACLASLWAIKSSPAGIMFPVLVALLVPVRIYLTRFFEVAQLEAMDDCGDPVADGRAEYIATVAGGPSGQQAGAATAEAASGACVVAEIGGFEIDSDDQMTEPARAVST